ncbi:hypothetical protein EZ456_02180 [Pedobacter psychrodurus]|uniref:Tox-MPTase3 domain-containing protein n=1 Tax=Pedobacter psychrodurus TaxID=2530456 RepID=A0A4R0Q583_9SPHI|nr:hypothetical protein [Pedobacter psychrodurus]TCD28989.1 hypothetical protein EZ456_02180 [Pedobacter psychrodurus]
MKYPTLSKIVDALYDKVKNNPKLLAALVKYSKLSEAKVLENLKSGKGPLLLVKTDMPNDRYAQFDPNTGHIELSGEYASKLNQFEFDPKVSTMLEFFITSTILHEFVHFGNDLTNITPATIGFFDAGKQFENYYYGGDVNYNPTTKNIYLVKMP